MIAADKGAGLFQTISSSIRSRILISISVVFGSTVAAFAQSSDDWLNWQCTRDPSTCAQFAQDNCRIVWNELRTQFQLATDPSYQIQMDFGEQSSMVALMEIVHETAIQMKASQDNFWTLHTAIMNGSWIDLCTTYAMKRYLNQ